MGRQGTNPPASPFPPVLREQGCPRETSWALPPPPAPGDTLEWAPGAVVEVKPCCGLRNAKFLHLLAHRCSRNRLGERQGCCQPGLNPSSAIRESRDSRRLEISPSVPVSCSALLAEQTSSVLLQHPANGMQSLTEDQGWAMGPLQVRGWSPLLVVFCHPGWEGAVDR